MSTNENALIPSTENALTVNPSAALMTSVGDLSGLSFAERTTVLARFTKIASDPDFDLSEVLGKELPIVDVFYHQITLTNDKTGEITHPYRCVFLTQNDETIACVSDGAKRFIDLVKQVYDKFPLSSPFVMVPTQINTRSGNRTYNFVVKADGQ